MLTWVRVVAVEDEEGDREPELEGEQQAVLHASLQAPVCLSKDCHLEHGHREQR